MEDLGAYCVFQLQLLEDLLSTGLPPIETDLILRRIQILHSMLARYDAQLAASRMPVRQTRLNLPRPSPEALRLSILLCAHLTDKVSEPLLARHCEFCQSDGLFCSATGFPHGW